MADKKVLYARATYGEEEKKAVREVLENPERLSGGEKTERFEEEVAELFGKEYGVMVNSGSSANLLAVELLDLERGAEVITPALTFSTTVAPLVQKDLKPVFVDSEPGTYQMDVDQVEEAVSDDTRAVMAPSLLGNVPDLERLREICDRHDLYLIEDSADTIGATFGGEPTGTYSDISTTSFYGSHVITAFGGGGMLCVNDRQLSRRARKLRGWGRASAAEETEDIDERLSSSLEGVSYDSKFVFDEIGYNLQTIEASAAFGLEQLEKLPDFTRRRRENFRELKQFFSDYRDVFVLPETGDKVETAWLGFPLTVREEAPFERNELARYLEENGIQTRSLFSGNILRHPGFSDIEHRRARESFPVADRVMEGGLVVGCHQSMDSEKLEYVKQSFREFLEDR